MPAARASLLIRTLGIALVLALPPAPGRAASGPTGPALQSKPDASARRCLAATRRVERQSQIVADVDARIERERQALASCSGKGACDRRERALGASQMRKSRYQKQLLQFQAEAKAACTPVAAAINAGPPQ